MVSIFRKKKKGRAIGSGSSPTTNPQDSSISLTDELDTVTRERDSLQETIEMLQGEVVRTKTENMELRAFRRETIETQQKTMALSNKALDDKLIIAGTVNRAREVAQAMSKPLLLMNDCIPQLPPPTTPIEEQALFDLADSMALVARYANMIGNDGTQVENFAITQALDEDRVASGKTPLLSGPEGGTRTAEVLQAINDLKLSAGYKIHIALTEKSPHDDGLLLRGMMKGPGSHNMIPFTITCFTESPLEDILYCILEDLEACIKEHNSDITAQA